MTSAYPVEDFRKKLLLLCDVKLPAIRFMRSPTSSSKPFIGEITDETFELRKNFAVFATTYYIVGDYKKLGDKTDVFFGLKRSRFEYYLLRILPLILIPVISVSLFKSVTIFELLKIDFIFVALFGFVIWMDGYYGKRMVLFFKEQMKISE